VCERRESGLGSFADRGPFGRHRPLGTARGRSNKRARPLDWHRSASPVDGASAAPPEDLFEHEVGHLGPLHAEVQHALLVLVLWCATQKGEGGPGAVNVTRGALL